MTNESRGWKNAGRDTDGQENHGHRMQQQQHDKGISIFCCRVLSDAEFLAAVRHKVTFLSSVRVVMTDNKSQTTIGKVVTSYVPSALSPS